MQLIIQPRWGLGVLAALVGACTTPSAPAPRAPGPELALDGVTLRVYRNSDPQLLARAAHLELARSTGELTARDVHFDFLADSASVDAPRLSGSLSSQAFELTGGVVLHSGALTGRTEAAHFEGRDGLHGIASGVAPIAVEGVAAGRPYSLTADRFRFDVAEQRATFEPARTKVGAP